MEAVATATTFPRRLTSERSFVRRSWDRFKRNKLAMAGLVYLTVMIVAAILASVIAPFDPEAIDLKPASLLQPPSTEHYFGTDELGRDGFSRALFGSRISLAVGFIAAAVTIILGVIIGGTAGMLGGWVDSVLMRSVDILLAVPLFFLVMISQIIITPSIYSLMIVIGLTNWMEVARLSRGEFLHLGGAEFVTAARVTGSSTSRLAWRHILPNASGPIIVSATLCVAEAIILESTLSFIGLGVQPPQASLGSMLQKGLTRLQDAPWMVWFPGFLIAITVVAFNFVGDGIRDALDPKHIR